MAVHSTAFNSIVNMGISLEVFESTTFHNAAIPISLPQCRFNSVASHNVIWALSKTSASNRIKIDRSVGKEINRLTIAAISRCISHERKNGLKFPELSLQLEDMHRIPYLESYIMVHYSRVALLVVSLVTVRRRHLSL